MRSQRIQALTAAAAAVFVTALCTVACGAGSSNSTGGPEMAALGAEKGEGGTIIERFDLSGDGKPDLWKIFQIKKEGDTEARTMIRKEMDLNFDGRLDIRQFVTPNNKVYREEMDLDFDGHIDATAHYKDGRLIKRELDLSFDGKPDIFKYYEDGKLIRKERATNKEGRVDVWEFYEEGRLVRVGRDKDGDGKPEIFNDAPEPEPEIPGGAPSN